MFMTGVPPPNTNNYIYMATSGDGVNFSLPTMVISDIWQPSATFDAFGNAIVYGNMFYDDNTITAIGLGVLRYNMGANGQTIKSRDIVATGASASCLNPDVKFRPAANLYELVCEGVGNRLEATSGLSFFRSDDSSGTTFHIVTANIVVPRAGQYHVRTPGLMTEDAQIIYYAETVDPLAMQNQIRVVQWDSAGRTALN